jgi:hypothetical protein
VLGVKERGDLVPKVNHVAGMPDGAATIPEDRCTLRFGHTRMDHENVRAAKLDLAHVPSAVSRDSNDFSKAFIASRYSTTAPCVTLSPKNARKTSASLHSAPSTALRAHHASAVQSLRWPARPARASRARS